MDGRTHLVSVCLLGFMGLGAMVIMGICAAQGQQIPAAVGAAFGIAVGALSSQLPGPPPPANPH